MEILVVLLMLAIVIGLIGLLGYLQFLFIAKAVKRGVNEALKENKALFQQTSSSYTRR